MTRKRPPFLEMPKSLRRDLGSLTPAQVVIYMAILFQADTKRALSWRGGEWRKGFELDLHQIAVLTSQHRSTVLRAVGALVSHGSISLLRRRGAHSICVVRWEGGSSGATTEVAPVLPVEAEVVSPELLPRGGAGGTGSSGATTEVAPVLLPRSRKPYRSLKYARAETSSETDDQRSSSETGRRNRPGGATPPIPPDDPRPSTHNPANPPKPPAHRARQSHEPSADRNQPEPLRTEPQIDPPPVAPAPSQDRSSLDVAAKLHEVADRAQLTMASWWPNRRPPSAEDIIRLLASHRSRPCVAARSSSSLAAIVVDSIRQAMDRNGGQPPMSPGRYFEAPIRLAFELEDSILTQEARHRCEAKEREAEELAFLASLDGGGRQRGKRRVQELLRTIRAIGHPDEPKEPVDEGDPAA